jgi:hypothetical protein
LQRIQAGLQGLQDREAQELVREVRSQESDGGGGKTCEELPTGDAETLVHGCPPPQVSVTGSSNEKGEPHPPRADALPLREF